MPCHLRTDNALWRRGFDSGIVTAGLVRDAWIPTAGVLTLLWGLHEVLPEIMSRYLEVFGADGGVLPDAGCHER